jgi:hypothetical protein
MRIEPLTIGEKSFHTHRAAQLFIHRLRNSQPLRKPIPEPQHSFLCALVARHPDANGMVGAGIRHFTVELVRLGTPCFHLTRVDGTKMDFSYFECLRREA